MIGEIENAILARIKAASDSGALGYQLKTIGTYQAEFDDDPSTFIPKFPAVLVVFAGEAEPERRSQTSYVCRPSFALICGARNLRNEQARRHGGAAGEIGAYQIVTDMRALVMEQDLGLEIDPLVPGQVRSIFNGKTKGLQAAVYAFEVSTRYDIELPTPGDGALAPFETFHADWDVPPFLDPKPAGLPLDAGAADATDDVTNLQE